jgi:hypothetical protein
MLSVVGIFRSLQDASQAVARLRAIPVPADKINVLSPGPADQEQRELAQVPLSEAEQPGLGGGLGAVVGGALGLAGGMFAGTAVASLFIPGVGPIVAIGLAAAGILGAGGAVAGAKAGSALEAESTRGLPEDELFFYEDALKSGHTVVIAFAENERQAEQLRDAFRHAGAESLDAAREKWWIGLRDTEKVHYEDPGHDLQDRESIYRCGFEAALRPGVRGKSNQEAKELLRRSYPDRCDEGMFIRGYERGREFEAQRRKGADQRRVA